LVVHVAVAAEGRPLANEGQAAKAIVWAGFVSGTLDILAAIEVYGRDGLRAKVLLQGIAKALIGESAYDGGWATAGLGLALHFVIAFGAATVFFVASRWMRFLLAHWVIWGALYGVAVYFFMQLVVLPLTRATRYPLTWQTVGIGVAIHIVCVGWPIAALVRVKTRKKEGRWKRWKG
jgi:hypothetical protein